MGFVLTKRCDMLRHGVGVDIERCDILRCGNCVDIDATCYVMGIVLT